MRIGSLLLVLVSLPLWAQIPTPIRTVTTLPATCNGGTTGVSTDMVALVSGGTSSIYTCSATNTWTQCAISGDSLSCVGPFSLKTPFAGAILSCSVGNSCLEINTDGNFYISNNGGTFIPIGAVSVNGSVVAAPNFNATTPAAGSNGLNVIWQVSGSSVSAEVVGNGSSTQFLNGTGAYSTPAGVSPGGSTDATQYNAGGGSFGGVNSPVLQGQYSYGYVVPTAAAVVPTNQQVGLGGRTISGATSTDTVAFGDVDTVINHDIAGSASVTETIPVPTTAVGSGGLGNTTFAFQYCNHSLRTDTLSPTTWTIQNGTLAAAATLSVAPLTCYRVKVDPFNATNWIADGSTPPVIATGGNLSPLNNGQVAASQTWLPTGTLPASMSFATSGGSFQNGHAISVRIAFVNPSGTTFPSMSATGSNVSFGCSTGAACLLTITAPSVPTGYSGYNVYAQDCASNPCGGSEVLQAACTNITANCVLSTVGGGGAIPTTISAYAQPPNVQPSICPQSVTPWLYMPDNAGNYRVVAGNSLFSNNSRTSGTLNFCLPVRFDDQTGTAPVPGTGGTPNFTGEPSYGNNAFVSIQHSTCIYTSCANQDRALWINVQNPFADNTQHYSITGLQSEIDISGHPTWVGAVDAETAVFSGQLIDETDASYSAGTPGGGSQTMRLTYVREPATGGTGLGVGGAIYTNTNNGYSSAAPGGTLLYGADITWGGGGTTTNLTGIGINIGFPTTAQLFGTGNYGIAMGYPGPLNSNIPTANATTYGIVSAINGLKWTFNGPTSMTQVNSALTGNFAFNGAITDTGSFTTAQLTASVLNSVTCTGGASQYTYEIVAVDGNGGQALGTPTNSGSTCVNPLTSGNPATITNGLTTAQVQQAFRFDVYRTAGPMGTGKIGSLTCVQGTQQPSCQAFSDTGLTASGSLPTSNTTGTIVAAGPTISTPSGPVSGSWQCTNVSPVSVSANVSTDQNLLACTVPAGTLNALNKSLRIWLAGVYSTPAASTTAVTVKVKLCTVSGCGSGTVVSLLNITTTALAGVQATNDQFNIHAYSTTQTAGTTASFEAHGNLLIDLGVGNTVADSNFGDTNTATVGTIDTTAQLFLQSTVSFSSASASNTASARQLVVDTVN